MEARGHNRGVNAPGARKSPGGLKAERAQCGLDSFTHQMSIASVWRCCLLRGGPGSCSIRSRESLTEAGSEEGGV
jgi:hypothetical protein